MKKPVYPHLNGIRPPQHTSILLAIEYCKGKSECMLVSYSSSPEESTDSIEGVFLACIKDNKDHQIQKIAFKSWKSTMSYVYFSAMK